MIHTERMEINVVRQCNNRCASCAHGAPFAEEEQMAPEILQHDLDVLKPMLHVQHLWLTGGEPLLHSNLAAMAKIAKTSQVGDRVCVQSNARLIEKAPEDLWNFIDVYSVSIYANLENRHLELAKKKCLERRVEFGARPFYSFGKQFKHDPIGQSFYGCTVKRIVFTADNGYFFRCPQSAIYPKRWMGLPANTDGIALDDQLTEELLAAFMSNESEPLKTCTICSPQSEEVPWHECDSIEDYIRDSTLTGQAIFLHP